MQLCARGVHEFCLGGGQGIPLSPHEPMPYYYVREYRAETRWGLDQTYVHRISSTYTDEELQRRVDDKSKTPRPEDYEPGKHFFYEKISEAFRELLFQQEVKNKIKEFDFVPSYAEILHRSRVV